MRTLTKKQAAQIFAMYYGASVYSPRYADRYTLAGVYDDKICLRGDSEQINTFSLLSGADGNQDEKLILKPLNRILTADAIEVVHLESVVYLNIEIHPWSNGDGFRRGFSFEFEYESSRRRRRSQIYWSSINSVQTQFLARCGYAIPLWIDMDHPDNGQTAIDLDLAVVQ